jgi:hypothetical protein
MKVFLFLFIGVSAFASQLFGQTVTDIKFEYDDAGNRTKRVIYYDSGGQKSTPEEPEEEEQPEFEKGLNVYPNPATHSIYVTLNEEVLESLRQELYVFDNLGRQLFQSDYLAEINQIDVSQWPIGTYIIKLVYDNKHEEWIIIKK